jgi:hypothetical protein
MVPPRETKRVGEAGFAGKDRHPTTTLPGGTQPQKRQNGRFGKFRRLLDNTHELTITEILRGFAVAVRRLVG